MKKLVHRNFPRFRRKNKARFWLARGHLPAGADAKNGLWPITPDQTVTVLVPNDLYLTGHGVTVFGQAGKVIGPLDGPEKWLANVCFGGADHRFRAGQPFIRNWSGRGF